MTGYPSNQDRDWTRTQAAPWRTPSPDVPTMAAYVPPTSARPTAPVPPPPPGYGPQFVPAYAWSAEQPEFNSAPTAYSSQQPWYARPRVLTFAAAGFVAAAGAGLFGALHSSSANAPVTMATHSAPAPVPAPAPTPSPAPVPAPAAQPSAPTYRSPSHSSISTGGYSKPASHQGASQSPPPPPAPAPDQSGQSDPSQWNHGGNYRWNHSGDHDGRWNFWNRDHDSDGSNYSHGNSHSDSNENGDSE